MPTPKRKRPLDSWSSVATSFGGDDGIALGEQGYAGAEQQCAGDRGCGSQSQEGVEQPVVPFGQFATGRVRRALRGRDTGVFDDEERVEPTLFECLG